MCGENDAQNPSWQRYKSIQASQEGKGDGSPHPAGNTSYLNLSHWTMVMCPQNSVLMPFHKIYFSTSIWIKKSAAF